MKKRGERLNFENRADLEKIKKRIQTSFYKFTRRSEGFEDCAQEVITRMLEGRHQHSTIDQAVIDYLREHRNFKGFRRNLKSENYPISNSYEQGSFDRFIGSDPRGDLGDRIDFDRIIGMSKHWERAVMILYFREEHGQAEIGNLFGVSESRVSQWLERIQGRISTRIAAEESRAQRAKQKEMARVLSPEAIGNGWGVGEVSFEGMEISQSWSLASFNEESF